MLMVDGRIWIFSPHFSAFLLTENSRSQRQNANLFSCLMWIAKRVNLEFQKFCSRFCLFVCALLPRWPDAHKSSRSLRGNFKELALGARIRSSSSSESWFALDLNNLSVYYKLEKLSASSIETNRQSSESFRGEIILNNPSSCAQNYNWRSQAATALHPGESAQTFAALEAFFFRRITSYYATERERQREEETLNRIQS